MEDLYSPDETNVTIHIENLADYIQPSSEVDLQALGHDDVFLQFYGKGYFGVTEDEIGARN